MHIKTVNKSINHFNLQLIRGNGYFYFIGLDGQALNEASIYVYRLNHLSLNQWVSEAKLVAALNKSYLAPKTPNVASDDVVQYVEPPDIAESQQEPSTRQLRCIKIEPETKLKHTNICKH
jgi:hypothetical protein